MVAIAAAPASLVDDLGWKSCSVVVLERFNWVRRVVFCGRYIRRRSGGSCREVSGEQAAEEGEETCFHSGAKFAKLVEHGQGDTSQAHPLVLDWEAATIDKA